MAKSPERRNAMTRKVAKKIAAVPKSLMMASDRQAEAGQTHETHQISLFEKPVQRCGAGEDKANFREFGRLNRKCRIRRSSFEHRVRLR